ncbi:hypothetical protein C2E23DRAFT_723644 [Lenzites betulinus]|nr:hypothetical protein C2E23DRAFT_723644 [Lenzites betulinus]
MVFSPILLAALLPLAARAANDWTKPCFSQCEWSIPSGDNSATVQIAGPHAAVSDITPAAGWMIMDCDQNSTDQDIRLVCQDPGQGCDHVYTDSAAGTVVRLPQDCGAGPFAMITKEWVHKDQSIPASKRSSIVRRDGSQPVVKGMTLSTNFSDPNVAGNGNVTLFFVGSNVPGAAGNFTVTPPTDALAKRDLFSWIGDTINSATFTGVIHGFDKNLTANSPININENFPVFDQSIDCPQKGNVPGFSGEVKIDLNTKITGNVVYGIAAAGKLIPPEITEFGLFVDLDADILATLGLDATLTGTLDSGKHEAASVGIPGLTVPGVFDIGPALVVNVQATASLDANVNMDVDLAYTVSGLRAFFPPGGSNSNAGSFNPGDSNLALSVSPNVTAHGQVTAHLIPTLQLGISAIGGSVKTTVNLDLDADAALDLSLTGGAQVTVTTADGTDADAELEGCVDVTSSLNVNIGADADFFSLFQKGASVNLFSKTFDLFKKCFGATTARRSYTGRAARAALLARDDPIICPTDPLASVVSIVKSLIPASR